LKLNERSESFEKLTGVADDVDENFSPKKYTSPVKQISPSPLMKGETSKMRTIREQRTRSQVRRAQMEISPERQATAITALREQNNRTPVKELTESIE